MGFQAEEMTVRTSKQSKQNHVQIMGEDLGNLYSALFQETAWIYIKWLEYKELYYNPDGQNRRVELLNLAAKGFFGMLQRILSEEVSLGIARITGPSKSRGKENLTIQRLPDMIEDESLKTQVQKKVKDAVDSAGFAQDLRNRHLAHRDLLLALEDSNAEPLKEATVDKIETALQKITEALEAVSGSDIRLENTVRSHGARSLLQILEYGVKGRNEFLEGLKNRTHNMGDAPKEYI